MDDDGVTGVYAPDPAPEHDDARSALAALVAHEPAMHASSAHEPERVRLDPTLALIAQHAHEWRRIGRPASRSGLAKTATPLLEELRERVRSVSPHEWNTLRLALHYQRRRQAEEDAEARRALAWGAIILLGGLAILAFLASRAARPASGATAPTTTPALLAPAYRPPYNPDLHGSVEAYRASFGHLPAGPASVDAGEAVVGLDRSRRI